MLIRGDRQSQLGTIIKAVMDLSYTAGLHNVFLARPLKPKSEI